MHLIGPEPDLGEDKRTTVGLDEGRTARLDLGEPGEPLGIPLCGPLHENLEDKTARKPDSRAAPRPAPNRPNPGVLDPLGHLLPQERPKVAVPLYAVN